MSSLWCGEYSMVAHPFSSTLPNTGALSLLQIQLFCQVPSDVAFHSPALSILLPSRTRLHFLESHAISFPTNSTDHFLDPRGGLFPVNLTDWFLVPQAVSALPTPAHSRGLTSGAEVSVPSPHSSVSVFGDCARSSDDLFGSHSALQISDLLLHSSLHLEIPPIRLIFPSSR